MPTGLLESLAENPFFVLGLPADCPRAMVEREGQKLLSMLALELKEAAHYLTPVGTFPRTETKVRAAMAELREPTKRLFHELLARAQPPQKAPEPEALVWPTAQEAFSLGSSRRRG